MTHHRLYDDLAPWWPLLAPPETYADDCALTLDLLGRPGSLLELGSGAGHFAHHVPVDVDLVLADLSPAMLAVSRELNPARQHVEGDMRSLRLDRTFDAVLLHDAVMYLPDADALGEAFATAAAHLRPGGLFLVLPDVCAEGFEEATVTGGGDGGGRSARMMEWHWDPDPDDGRYRVDFSFLLREGDDVRSVHEHHDLLLLPRAAYWERLMDAGFEPAPVDLLLAAQAGTEVFLARKR
jgi:SAM-dependent methyltransferase